MHVNEMDEPPFLGNEGGLFGNDDWKSGMNETLRQFCSAKNYRRIDGDIYRLVCPTGIEPVTLSLEG